MPRFPLVQTVSLIVTASVVWVLIALSLDLSYPVIGLIIAVISGLLILGVLVAAHAFDRHLPQRRPGKFIEICAAVVIAASAVAFGISQVSHSDRQSDLSRLEILLGRQENLISALDFASNAATLLQGEAVTLRPNAPDDPSFDDWASGIPEHDDISIRERLGGEDRHNYRFLPNNVAVAMLHEVNRQQEESWSAAAGYIDRPDTASLLKPLLRSPDPTVAAGALLAITQQAMNQRESVYADSEVLSHGDLASITLSHVVMKGIQATQLNGLHFGTIDLTYSVFPDEWPSPPSADVTGAQPSKEAAATDRVTNLTIDSARVHATQLRGLQANKLDATFTAGSVGTESSKATTNNSGNRELTYPNDGEPHLSLRNADLTACNLHFDNISVDLSGCEFTEGSLTGDASPKFSSQTIFRNNLNVIFHNATTGEQAPETPSAAITRANQANLVLSEAATLHKLHFVNEGDQENLSQWYCEPTLLLDNLAIENSYIASSQFGGVLAGWDDSLQSKERPESDDAFRADEPSAVFRNCDLTNSSFSGARLRNVDFRGSTLAGCDFSNAALVGCNFIGVEGLNDQQPWSGCNIQWCVVNLNHGMLDEVNIAAVGNEGSFEPASDSQTLQFKNPTLHSAFIRNKCNILVVAEIPDGFSRKGDIGDHTHIYLGYISVAKRSTVLWNRGRPDPETVGRDDFNKSLEKCEVAEFDLTDDVVNDILGVPDDQNDSD